jgi:hypothetical protein
VGQEPQLREQPPLPLHGRHRPEPVGVVEEEADLGAVRAHGERHEVRVEDRPRARVEGQELVLGDLGVEEVAGKDHP